TLAEGRNAIRDVVEKEAKKPSRKRRTRATRYLGQPKAQSEEVPLPINGPWTAVAIAGAPQSAPPVPPAEGPPPATPPRGPEQTSSVQSSSSPPAAIEPDDLDVEGWGITSTDP